MTVQINANQFSLKYIPEEDRMLFCVTISAEHEIGTLLTRRIARWLIDALMKHAPDAQIASDAAKEDAAARGKGPEGERAREGKDNKENREAREEKPRALAVPPKLVREVKIAPRENGDLALIFNTGEQQIVLDVAAGRILTIVEIFLDLAGKAGWDFAGIPPKPAKTVTTESEARKVLH
jgi:hypothetical protein